MFVKGRYEQSTNINTTVLKNTHCSVLLVFTSWWIFVVVVNVIYKSQLASLLIPKPTQSVTFENLVDQGYEIIMNSNVTYEHMFLENEVRLIER